MSYRFEAGRIYRMPTHFGPAPGPRQLPDGVVPDPKNSPRTVLHTRKMRRGELVSAAREWTAGVAQRFQPERGGRNREARRPPPLIFPGAMKSKLEEKHSSVDLGDVLLHWTEAGQGPPLVLLHGMNDSHRTWRDVWPRLPGRRILMLDLPGHGMSGRPDAPYTLDWNATQVARWMQHLALVDADVLGHSYGGGVAQWLLLKCRPRIRRLGLLASGGLGREVGPWLRLASLPFVVERFGQRWMGRIAESVMSRATTSDAGSEIALLASYLRKPGSARAFSRTVRDVIRWRGQTRNLFDRIDDVAELPPMRLFWGARDRILPISHGTAIARILENCELIHFEKHGHFVHWEDPDGFARALGAFLDARDVPAARVRGDSAAATPARRGGVITNQSRRSRSLQRHGR